MPPVTARLETCVPLTYRRSVLPSYVEARCVQLFSGVEAVPRVSNSSFVKTCALGRPAPSPA